MLNLQPLVRLLFVVATCYYLCVTAAYGQCTGGAVWIGSIPANGALTGSATLQGGATVNVTTAGTGYEAGYPQYANNPILTYNGNQFRMLRIIRRGARLGNSSKTTFDFSHALDSNIIHFRVRDLRNDGVNVETQDVLGFNNGVPVSATYTDPINGAGGSGTTVYGPTNSTSTYQGIIRIHFNDKVDCVIIRKASLDDFIEINMYARCLVLLPFSLSDFSLTRLTNTVRLQWITTEAYNFSHFIVEKSTDAINWSAIGMVDITGNSGNKYSFNDTSLQPGINFYRLKTIDHDGLVTYSKVINYNYAVPEPDPVRIVQNPIKDEMLLISKLDIPIRLRVFLQDGRMLGVHNIIKGTNKINTSHWLGGLYYIHLFKPDGTIQILKVIKN